MLSAVVFILVDPEGFLHSSLSIENFPIAQYVGLFLIAWHSRKRFIEGYRK